jgi:type I restriction enzyme S subunit
VRFKRETEFQDAEIGKIPKEWRIEKLGRIVKYVKGKKPSVLFDEKSSEEYIPYLTAEYMRGLDKPKWCNLKLENSVVEVSYDDVIMIWDGSYAGHVFTGFNGVLASTMVKIIPIVELDKKFLYYYLLVNFEKFRSTTVGTGIPHVNKKVFEEFPIPVPPIHEQKRIAEVLSTVDRAIEVVDAGVVRLEGLKKALMRELLTGRIRIREENSKLVFYRETEFQDTEIGKIPRDWHIAKLGELIEMNHGKRPEIILQEGDVPIYGGGGFYGYTNTYLVDEPYILILARVGKGSVGKVYLARGKIWVTDNAIYGYSRDPSGIATVYAYYWLQFDRTWVERYVRRSAGGYAIITLNSLNNLKLPLPLLNEQKGIVETLSIIDKSIELHYKEKEKLEHLKKGLMDLLLTGKIRVVEG